jgi:hypothetical protein
MSDPVIALVMLGILVASIMIGFPVAFTLMALGVGFGYYAYFQPGQDFFDNRVFYLLTQNTFTVMNNDALVSIPLFLLMGYLVERANILDTLFASLQLALRAVRARSRWRPSPLARSSPRRRASSAPWSRSWACSPTPACSRRATPCASLRAWCARGAASAS